MGTSTVLLEVALPGGRPLWKRGGRWTAQESGEGGGSKTVSVGNRSGRASGQWEAGGRMSVLPHAPKSRVLPVVQRTGVGGAQVLVQDRARRRVALS